MEFSFYFSLSDFTFFAWNWVWESNGNWRRDNSYLDKFYIYLSTLCSYAKGEKKHELCFHTQQTTSSHDFPPHFAYTHGIHRKKPKRKWIIKYDIILTLHALQLALNYLQILKFCDTSSIQLYMWHGKLNLF